MKKISKRRQRLTIVNDELGSVDLSKIPPIDCLITSPPYKDRDGYSNELMARLGLIMNSCMNPGARAFVNFGQLREDFGRVFEVPLEIKQGDLRIGQTIIWIKSISIDGPCIGHMQPINSSRTLNYAWEFIYTFYRDPEPDIDRLSIGVPFADKSNLTRGGRGTNGDIRCAGDTWFIPYKTTGRTTKKKHRYEFPEELVERCIKLSNLKPNSIIMDPFSGSGTVASVAKRLGHSAVIIDRDPESIGIAADRWSSV
jgi:site-specific DNA-methyltransferase (adenine-specific)